METHSGPWPTGKRNGKHCVFLWCERWERDSGARPLIALRQLELLSCCSNNPQSPCHAMRSAVFTTALLLMLNIPGLHARHHREVEDVMTCHNEGCQCCYGVTIPTVRGKYLTDNPKQRGRMFLRQQGVMGSSPYVPTCLIISQITRPARCPVHSFSRKRILNNGGFVKNKVLHKG